MKFMPLLACLTMHRWRDGNNHDNLYGLFAMVNYDMLFMSAGMVDNFYWYQHKNTIKKASLDHPGTPMTLTVMSFVIAITMPAM